MNTRINNGCLQPCAVALCLIIAGCAGLSQPSTDSLAGTVIPVIARHDAYANELLSGDELVSELQKSSVALRIFQANTGGALPPEFGPAMAPVLDRHDTWVQQDKTLDTAQREVYLHSTAALRLALKIKE